MSGAAPQHRQVARLIRGEATSDGAGVKLTRVIGGRELPDLDPFLLFDEFGSTQGQDYIAGFPDHPHRGFETVTYMLAGRMRHRDNQGNSGLLVPGSVQWMTAGRGIVHSEMPEQQDGLMRGFQLWVNLPAREKLTAPRYQDIAPENIPQTQLAPGVLARVLAGALGAINGPVSGVSTEPLYLDLHFAANAEAELALPPGHTAFCFVYEGSVLVLGAGQSAPRAVARAELAVLTAGDRLRLRAGESAARCVLVAGKPLREPIARYGPFVMNTREEIMQAFADFNAGRL
jgi:redox-sensitive bicupin YhaK (pirin superfamily)